jgi:hypothetical protein
MRDSQQCCRDKESGYRITVTAPVEIQQRLGYSVGGNQSGLLSLRMESDVIITTTQSKPDSNDLQSQDFFLVGLAFLIHSLASAGIHPDPVADSLFLSELLNTNPAEKSVEECNGISSWI